MLQIEVTVFAAILGLACGSFLNVCATRWPEEQSILRPRSHCRNCQRTLAWWENLPVLSWLALRGRCRTCKAWIGLRYPLAELAVAGLWACTAWFAFLEAPELGVGRITDTAALALANAIARAIFLWILVALAVMDAENLWLPDRLTFPGIVLGFLLAFARGGIFASMVFGGGFDEWRHHVAQWEFFWFIGAVVAAAFVVLIRWAYFVVRGQEGMGLGDAKLLAMIGGWLGIRCVIATFAIAVVLGCLVALAAMARTASAPNHAASRLKKLPFGTFLCLGAMICAFWGQAIVHAYQQWAGF